MRNWYTNGQQTNPASNAVLASTGALTGIGSHTVHIITSSDIATTAVLQYLDTNGTTVLASQNIYLAANTVAQCKIPNEMVDNRSYKLIVVNAVTGHVSGSIIVMTGG